MNHYKNALITLKSHINLLETKLNKYDSLTFNVDKFDKQLFNVSIIDGCDYSIYLNEVNKNYQYLKALFANDNLTDTQKTQATYLLEKLGNQIIALVKETTAL